MATELTPAHLREIGDALGAWIEDMLLVMSSSSTSSREYDELRERFIVAKEALELVTEMQCTAVPA